MIKLFYVDRNATYKEWELLPNKLFIVEDIEAYLATKSAHTINDFQYIKNDLEIGVNIDFSQSYSQPKATTSFKYVAIQNTGENIHYYFVKKAVWRSKSCVRFELVMDVLNTFKEGYDYEFKANTKITREHKDRFVVDETYRSIDLIMTNPSLVGSLNVLDNVTLSSEQGAEILTGVIMEIEPDDYITLRITSSETDEEIYTAISTAIEGDYFEIAKVGEPANYIRFYLEREEDYEISHHTNIWNKIDYVSEGINPILIRKTAPKSIEKTGILQQNWYLLYRNQNDPSESLVNPVDCYLIPENEVDTDSAYILGGRLIPSWLEEGKYYWFIVASGETFTLSNGVSYSYALNYYKRLLITKSNDKINVVYFYSTSGQMHVGSQYDDIEYIDITGLPANYNKYSSLPDITHNFIIDEPAPYEFTNSENYSKLSPISEIDRTDAKNIKLIKLPYIPYDFNVVSDVLKVNGLEEWEYASFEQSGGGIFYALHLLKNVKLQSNIDSNLNNPFDLLKHSDFTPDINDTRRIEDPKLLHSEFIAPTYVYDSFALRVDLEKCNLQYYIDEGTNNNIKFTMTSTINSKFMFTLASYNNNKSESNFYNVLPVARNNEVVLYNVPYINYIRTGFNYDIKNKNLQNVSNYIGLGLSAVSIGASLLMPTVPLKIAGVIGSLASMALSVKSTITSTIQNENSIKQKQEQYKNQASSVAGSDDVDLMSEYCGNRLLYMVYEPSDVMKALINDLFFYAGYASNRMGVPTHNNRINFDYLECDASIEKTSAMPEECLNELVGAFKNGVTYIHKTARTINKWDFAQVYENWENDLLED